MPAENLTTEPLHQLPHPACPSRDSRHLLIQHRLILVICILQGWVPIREIRIAQRIGLDIASNRHLLETHGRTIVKAGRRSLCLETRTSSPASAAHLFTLLFCVDECFFVSFFESHHSHTFWS